MFGICLISVVTVHQNVSGANRLPPHTRFSMFNEHNINHAYDLAQEPFELRDEILA
jgi:hypothetical protein